MISEKDLVELCRKNDRKGQQQLFDLYKRKVMSICLRYTQSSAEADDALQESFIRIFESLVKEKTTEIKSLIAWVTRITIRTAINMYHKSKKYDHVLFNDLSESMIADDAYNVLERMSADELLALVQAMPEGYRTVFNLYIIEGLDHHEIADELRITESSSRSQLARAKAWLRGRIVLNESTYERAVRQIS